MHFNNLRQLFAHKYRSVRFDAIVTTDNDAFDFIRSYRDALFPGVPVVFCGVNWFRAEQLQGLQGITGVAETADHKGTLELMLRLHPEARRIVVIIDDTTTGKVLRAELESELKGLRKQVVVDFWVEDGPAQLARKAATLPADSLVLLMPYASDASGAFIAYAEMARLISESSPVPVYASWDFYLGYGIVGGSLTTARDQGKAAGEMLQRLLNGERVENIPVRLKIPGVYTFDYRQLARFGIARNRLPEYSAIVHQPWYETNRVLIWVVALLALTLLALTWSLWSNLARKRKADVELRIAAKAFEAQVAMLVADYRGVILRVNQAFTESTGYSAEEAIGQQTSLLKSGRHDQAFYEAFWKALIEKHYWQGVIWNRRKNGSIYAEWLTINAVLSPSGEVTHYVSSFSDITQNKDAEAEVHRLAYYDPLTGLPNRRLLQDRLGQALALSAREGMQGALLFLDLDHFNTLNDTRGHDTGDQLLVQVGQRLRHTLPQADTVARLGGDEFVVILENLSDEPETAAAVARHFGELLGKAIALPYSLKGVNFVTTASIGVCLFNGDETVDLLLRNADMAMDQAKDAGRDAVRFFDPVMQAALDHRSRLEGDLRQALERKELEIHYQAQVNHEERVTGAELLLRWRHPERGYIPPSEFVPMAEESGLILSIGHWVMERACRQIADWAGDPRTNELVLSVNVSALQFRQEAFVGMVGSLLQETGIDPGRLKLELTESLILEDIDSANAKIVSLKTLGVRFSMDDFGTGYSSLSYLARLPLDEIKIDKSFVASLPGNRNDEVIAQTIITMGANLGLSVIAEGVETEAQRRFLEEHGCLAYQGYLFSRPVPLEPFMAYLLH